MFSRIPDKCLNGVEIGLNPDKLAKLATSVAFFFFSFVRSLMGLIVFDCEDRGERERERERESMR